MNTNYFMNLVAGNVFKTKTDVSLPANFYLGLSTSTPTASGSFTEPTGNGYARVQLTNLSQPQNGAVTNTQSVSMPESTGSWGTVTHFIITDAPTGGNLLMYGALAVPRTIEGGTVLTVTQNNLSLVVANLA